MIARDFSSRRLTRVGIIHIPWQNTAGNVDLALNGKHRREELKTSHRDNSNSSIQNDDRTSVTHSLLQTSRQSLYV